MLLLLAHAASAYETDQITDRRVPLRDSREVANAKMDELIDAAVAETNRLTACSADDDRTRKVLARRIHAATSRRDHVEPRGFFRGFGFGEYSSWLEEAPEIDRRTFPDRRDVFGGLAAPDSVVLGTVGPCSTINLAGVLMGTDKIDHFLAEGYHYASLSDWGAYPERGVRLGTTQERTYYGMMTSNAFSFADLRANWDGYLFYVGLLKEGSVVQRGEDGCVSRVRGFDWAEYVGWEYDEVLNPPILAPNVQEAVTQRLKSRRDQYCEGWSDWGPEVLETQWRKLVETPGYATAAAPERTDPWALRDLCGDLEELQIAERSPMRAR